MVRSEGRQSLRVLDWDNEVSWKDTSGKKEDLQRSRRLPNLTVFGMRLEHNFPRNKTSYKKEEWAEESARPQTARRNRGIHKVWTDVKYYLKLIVDARTKLEKCTIPTVPCIVTGDSEG